MVNPIYEDEPDLTDKENLELRALRRRYGWQPNRLSQVHIKKVHSLIDD